MSETEQIYHIPVLLDESVSGMNIQPGGIYVDVTFGSNSCGKGVCTFVYILPVAVIQL